MFAPLKIVTNAGINHIFRRERGHTLKDWEKWYLNLSQYEVYRHDDPGIDRILKGLATLPVNFSSKYS